MNKITLFMVIIAWLFTATYLVNVMESYTDGAFGISGNFDGVPTSTGDNAIEDGLDFAFMFFDILTFNVTGLPTIFVVLAFQVPTAGVVYMILDWIKDVIPFT